MTARAALPLSSANNDYTSSGYVASLQGETRRLIKEPTAANWPDTGVNQAVLDEYASLWSEISRTDARRRASAPTSMTYTSGALTVDLPAAAQNRPIVAVQDITGSSLRPVPLSYIPWDDLFDRFGNYLAYVVLNQTVVGNRQYSLLNNQIALFPPPGTGLTLQVTYLPAVDDLSSANHQIEVEHEPVLYWGAALRLLKADSEETPSMQATYNQMRADLMKSVKRWVRSRPAQIRRHRKYF